MSKINKISILFLLVMALLAFGVWQLIQTREFATIVADKFVAKIEKNYNIDFHFDHFNLQLFPPATILKEVRVKSKNSKKNQNYELYLNDFGIYFSFLDFLSNKITIEKISAVDGRFLMLDESKKNAKSSNFRLQSFFKKYDKDKFQLSKVHSFFHDEVLSKIPVKLNRIELSKIDMTFGGQKTWINNLELNFKRRKVIGFNLLCENFLVAYKKQQGVVEKKYIDLIKFKLKIEKEKISVVKFELKDRLDTYSFEGNVFKENDVNRIDGKLLFRGGVDRWFEFFPFEYPEKSIRGQANLGLQIKGELFSPEVKFEGEVTGYEFLLKKDGKLRFAGNRKGDSVNLSAFEISGGKTSISLSKPIKVFDLKRYKIVQDAIRLHLKNADLETMIKDFGSSYDRLHGTLSGVVDVNVNLNNKESKLNVTLGKGFSWTGFSLLKTRGSGAILSNPLIKFDQGKFVVNNKNEVEMFVGFSLGSEKTRVMSNGTISANSLSIKNYINKVDFEEFGPISGVPLKGNGIIKLDIVGPYDDVKLLFKEVSLEDFSVVGLNLGSVKTFLRYDLKDLSLHISDYRGISEGVKYFAKGMLIFGEKQQIDLSLDFPFARFKDSLYIYKNIFSLPNFVPNDLTFNYSAKYGIKGASFDKKDLNIYGDIDIKEIKTFGEEIDSLSMRFDYNKEKFSVDRFFLKKKNGGIVGSFTYDVAKEYLEYDAKLSGIMFTDFYLYNALKLGYDADVIGQFSGNGSLKKLITKSTLKFKNSTVNNFSVKDSTFSSYSKGTDFYVKGDFLEGEVAFDSHLNFDKDKKLKKSHFWGNVASEKINILLGVLFKHNIVDYQVSGKVDATIDSEFDVFNWRKLDLNLKVDDFFFNRKKVRLNLQKGRDEIRVRGGKIEKWDVALGGNGKGNFVSSFGEGVFYEKAKVEKKIKVDASALEMVIPYISNSKGSFDGRFIYFSEEDKFSTHFESKGNNLYFKLSNVPSAFDEVKYHLVWEGKELLIQKFSGKYGEGSFNVDGRVIFKFPFPTVDITFNIEQGQLSFLKKSSLVVSGQGKVEGEKFPYLLNGNFSLIHGEVLDGAGDFLKKRKKVVVHDRFLPQRTLKDEVEFLTYDVNVGIVRSVNVRNSLADLQFKGDGKISGTNMSPLFEARFELLKGVSKIRFRGHNFNANEGSITLSNRERKNYVDYNFLGEAAIGEYKVRLGLNGQSDSLSLKLSSEPALVQEDILSLLTLGVTSEVSKQLTDEERQSITSIGIGNFLVDQLELSKGLDTTLGMQLSIMPELLEDGTGYLTGSGSTQEMTATRMRSATKIKLRKNLAKNMNLAFSSTVGGTMGQKQEMGVEYNFLKNLSLQGVYEVKTTDSDSAQTQSSKSAGFDFIFRRSFK